MPRINEGGRVHRIFNATTGVIRGILWYYSVDN